METVNVILDRLWERSSSVGRVVAVADDGLLIATATGAKKAVSTGSTSYQIGDRVRIVNGIAIGRQRQASTIVRV